MLNTHKCPALDSMHNLPQLVFSVETFQTVFPDFQIESRGENFHFADFSKPPKFENDQLAAGSVG